MIGTRLPRTFEPGASPLVRQFTYDALDQVEETVSPAPESIQTRTTYDPVGRTSRVETDARTADAAPIPGGPFVETFGYDSEGHLTRHGLGGADEREHLVITYSSMPRV